MLRLQETEQGITFWALIQPRSAKNMIAGIHDDALKIKLTAPPVEGAANKMCIAFLAKCLGVPKSAVEIRSGLSSRKKRILVRWDPDASPKDRARIKNAVTRMIS